MVNKISAEEFYDDFAANYDDVVKDPKCNAQHMRQLKYSINIITIKVVF
ncbi:MULTISPECIES: hypothetical protein [Okeania]|nr:MULTISPECIES: hypothetical protein [Okeania]